MIVLVDQDGVIADFEKLFWERWTEKYPDQSGVPLTQRTTHTLIDQYPQELKGKVKQIYNDPGFFRSLPLIPGAKEAIIKMKEMGWVVKICTSPLTNYKHCILEKFEWVEENLGFEYTKDLIVTKDKTLVKADFLIDDRPHIGGVATPEWEHIIYDAPYNRQITDKRRVTWSNWESILLKQ